MRALLLAAALGLVLATMPVSADEHEEEGKPIVSIENFGHHFLVKEHKPGSGPGGSPSPAEFYVVWEAEIVNSGPVNATNVTLYLATADRTLSPQVIPLVPKNSVVSWRMQWPSTYVRPYYCLTLDAAYKVTPPPQEAFDNGTCAFTGKPELP